MNLTPFFLIWTRVFQGFQYDYRPDWNDRISSYKVSVTRVFHY
jgi:hypothetical protein